MRIAIDLQSCQTDSRDRGIGRYSLSLVEAICAELNPGEEVIICGDMADSRRLRDLRSELRDRGVALGLVAYGYPSSGFTDLSPSLRSAAGELRSRFFRSLSPDVLLITSLFETGSCFTTVLDWESLQGIRTAVVAYDLIPLIFPDRYLPKGEFVSNWYLERVEDLKRFDMFLSISEATSRDLTQRLGIPPERIRMVSAGFDAYLLNAAENAVPDSWLAQHGIDKPYVLTVGNGDWRKNTLGALAAFADLPQELRQSHLLVLTQVGDDVRNALKGKYAPMADSVCVLGKVDDATLAALYRNCKLFFFPSFYEGFGLPVLEAMAMGAAVLSSNLGSLPEVVHDRRMLFDPREHSQGVALLKRALEDANFRDALREGAKEHALEFTWKKTSRLALDALRDAGRSAAVSRGDWPSEKSISVLARACLDASHGPERALEHALRAIEHGQSRRILVDITEITRLDAHTGVQRVTRNIFAGLLAHAQARKGAPFSVEPFAWTERGIHYARGFARDRLGLDCPGDDDLLAPLPSDIAFMLDSSWWAPERFDDFHAAIWEAGGEVVWMVHDLIPLQLPETCDPVMPPVFQAWLTRAVLNADGFICNSEATRRDLMAFVDETLPRERRRRPWARSVRLGCDIKVSGDKAISEKIAELLRAIGSLPMFVALGTVEPRKDYATVLDAFERLWHDEGDAALVLIGKQGWNVEALVARIEGHPELGKRLFWLRGATDEDVGELMRRARALIQASIAEGFGLPIVEAGGMGVPLILSDIPVFREIAADHATYFTVSQSDELMSAVRSMMAPASEQQRTPVLQWPTWFEASHEVAQALIP